VGGVLATPSLPLRNPHQRDRDRIVHSKAFRRLAHKTQVFVAPQGDHFRTRLTHTLEVTGISRTVARALGLDEDLTEAIGVGHDLGHPPFGHIGEDALDACAQERFGRRFRHFEHSLRVVDVIERLALTDATRDGILCHSGRAPRPATPEGRIVRVVDRIAYINHDIDDAIRAGVLDPEALPADVLDVLGEDRIDTLVGDLVEHSAAAGDIVQGPEVGEAMDRLRSWMFEHVYLGPAARAEHAKIERVIRGLFDWFCAHPPASDPATGADAATAPADRVVDHIAGMTDRYAIREFTRRYVPSGLAA
jgi:dGTPase